MVLVVDGELDNIRVVLEQRYPDSRNMAEELVKLVRDLLEEDSA
jgi:hypothetical protein